MQIGIEFCSMPFLYTIFPCSTEILKRTTRYLCSKIQNMNGGYFFCYYTFIKLQVKYF
jgi:hypothetical protein